MFCLPVTTVLDICRENDIRYQFVRFLVVSYLEFLTWHNSSHVVSVGASGLCLEIQVY